MLVITQSLSRALSRGGFSLTTSRVAFYKPKAAEATRIRKHPNPSHCWTEIRVLPQLEGLRNEDEFVIVLHFLRC